MHTDSSTTASRRMLATSPALSAVRIAGEALKLQPLELLHAGPPLSDPRQPPAVLMSSAVMACLYEGWARDEQTAEAMIRAGDISLSPAQDRGCVTPLAFVVSPRAPLFEVSDGGPSVGEPRLGGSSVYSPVSTVRGADLRMGYRDPGLLARLADRDARIAPLWQRALEASGPVALLPIAAQALVDGDDLHSRTTAATRLLSGALPSHRAFAELAADLDATPLFFLTIWMAASALILRAAEGADLPSLVTRAGGNGQRFGIALAGSPDRWTCVDATAPEGQRLGTAPAGTLASAVIGDSPVIDMLGCGGQALARAEEPRQVLAGFLPDDHASLAARLCCVVHPMLQQAIGVDAARVRNEQSAPLVVLAMQAADGMGGFIGRGVYRPPVGLFEQALHEQGPG